MMLKLPKGVNCTMLVPYTPENTIDFPALSAMIDWYHDHGCKSLFAMCHSTEMHLLTWEERLSIIRFAKEKTLRMAQNGEAPMPVVAAGALSYDLDEMAAQIIAIHQAKADGVVIITNRLDPENQGEGTFIARGEELLKKIPEDIPLGLYECPEPYKRVMTDGELRWAVDTGRIHFLKDTCCDPEMLVRRMDIVRGSKLMLFNANAQTQLLTLRLGSAGYSSCMANIHPELFAWLCDHFEKYPRQAEKLQQLLTFMALSEAGLSYPLTAKYVMRCQGVPVEMNSRLHQPQDFTPYHKHIMDQLMALTQDIMAELRALDAPGEK